MPASPSGPRPVRWSTPAERSATCSWCSGRSTTRPTTLHIVSALRTPLLACGDDDLFRFKWERRGRWSYLADQPDTVPLDDPVRAALAYLRSLYEERTWLAPFGVAGADHPGPTSPGARLRRGPAPRRVAAAALRDRPGPGLERGHRREPAPVPALGDRADGRRGPGGRVDPARERRRRRAHPDHPRGQGARVPDHHRLGHVDRAVEPVGARRSGLSRQREPGRRHRRLQVREQGHHRRVRRVGPDRRADGPPRTHPPALRGLHQGPRPPDRVRAPQGAHQSAQTERPHQRRAAPRRHGRPGGRPARCRDRCETRSGRSWSSRRLLRHPSRSGRPSERMRCGSPVARPRWPPAR